MTMTLLPPNADILARIPSIATNSILKTLEDFGARGCSIKPPNDVYCGGRKIAGVLADASVTGSSSVVYLGVGINVNNDTSEIDRISETATSMRYETGSTLDLMEFAASLIASLDFEYARAIAEM